MNLHILSLEKSKSGLFWVKPLSTSARTYLFIKLKELNVSILEETQHGFLYNWTIQWTSYIEDTIERQIKSH